MQAIAAIVILIIMTSATGALVTAVWGILGFFIEKNGYLSLRYFLLLGSFQFWAVPYAFCGMLLYSAKVYGDAFLLFCNQSAAFYMWAAIFLMAWGGGFAAVLGRYFIENMRLLWLLKHSSECETWVYEIFKEACDNKQFISAERVRLRESYYTKGAKIAGVFLPTVILPMKEFTPEELRVIFYHELTHVQHKDTLMRNFLMLIQSLHFFNPVVWFLNGPFNLFSESSCDEYVCRHEDDIKHYYSVILKIVENYGDEKTKNFLVSQLLEMVNDLKQRITRVSKAMKRRKTTNRKGVCVLLLVMTLVLTLLATCFVTRLGIWGLTTCVPPQKDVGYIDISGNQSTQEDASLGADIEEEELSSYEKAVQSLLCDEAKILYQGYDVTEDFYQYVCDNYGESVVEALSEDFYQLKLESEDVGENNEAVIREFWHSHTSKSMHVLWYDYCLDRQNSDACLLQEIYVKECSTLQETVLDFTGDINFSEGWYTTNYMDSQANGIKDCISEDLREEMQNADLLIVNNEFVYSDRGTALEGKAYTYRAKPSRVSNLTTLGVDLAGLANNHTYDYGPDALLDTFDVLEAEGIPYVGAGRNLDEATKPVYFIVNGRKIAIVAATQIERSYNYTKQATETTPGVIKCLNPDLFVEEIKEAEANSDYVMVFVHWGTEREAYFAQDQTDLAKAFVGAGADVIIGGHTHCLQGITYYEEVPVFFSLGNFWQSKATLDTGIAQVILDENGDISTRFLPCIQSGCKTKLITQAEESNRILNYVEQISKGVTIDENGYVYNNNSALE